MKDFNDKKIVITGGCGFIGSHLLRALLKLPVRQVIVIDSMQYGHADELDYQDKRVVHLVHRLGVDPIDNIAQHCRDAEVLYHLAAQKHNQSISEQHSVYTENVFGAHQLFELAGVSNIKHVIFSSSLYAHGSYHSALMSENDIPEPRTAYGISKLAGEHLLKMFADRYGFDYTILRFFFVYGSRQFPGMGYKSVIVKNFERLLQGVPPVIFGDGTQALDYVHVDDVVEAMLLSYQKDTAKGALLHIGSGVPVSINDLTQKMCSVASVANNPQFKDADWTAGTVRATSTDRAQSLLGWKAKTSLIDGLLETYNWIKEYAQQK